MRVRTASASDVLTPRRIVRSPCIMENRFRLPRKSEAFEWHRYSISFSPVCESTALGDKRRVSLFAPRTFPVMLFWEKGEKSLSQRFTRLSCLTEYWNPLRRATERAVASRYIVSCPLPLHPAALLLLPRCHACILVWILLNFAPGLEVGARSCQNSRWVLICLLRTHATLHAHRILAIINTPLSFHS